MKAVHRALHADRLICPTPEARWRGQGRSGPRPAVLAQHMLDARCTSLVTEKSEPAPTDNVDHGSSRSALCIIVTTSKVAVWRNMVTLYKSGPTVQHRATKNAGGKGKSSPPSPEGHQTWQDASFALSQPCWQSPQPRNNTSFL